jgi:hypothetical protein
MSFKYNTILSGNQRLALHPFVGPWPFFSSVILYTDARTPWKGDQSTARTLPTHRTARTQNEPTHTSIPWIGFELTIPVFEREKRVYTLDRAATVMDDYCTVMCRRDLYDVVLDWIYCTLYIHTTRDYM